MAASDQSAAGDLQHIEDALDRIADDLCRAVDGDFSFTVATDSPHEGIQRRSSDA